MLAERRSVADLLDGIGSRGTPKVEGVSRRLFTSAEYHAMTEAGILSEDERVELIAGEIVRMAPIGSRHAGCVKRLNRRLSRLGDRALVSVQDPVALGLSDVFPLPEPPKGQPTIGRSLSFAGRPPFPVVPWTLDVCPCGVAPAIPVRPQVVQPCQGPATEVF